MIIDSPTSTIYTSSLFAEKYSDTFDSLTQQCLKQELWVRKIPTGRNEWCRDFMPVQINDDDFVLFKYNPHYLKGYPELIFDSDILSRLLGLKPKKSNIILDGGNIVSYGCKAIITEQIFHDNPGSKKVLIDEMKQLLEIDELIIIPYDPGDITRHADGMVRFFDENTVLVNNYAAAGNYSKNFINKLYGSLAASGLSIIQVPYYYTNDKTPDGMPSAEGVYINYLQAQNNIFLPQFGNPERDEEALLLFQRLFGKNVFPVDSLDLAKNGGGVLNCATWNIYDSKISPMPTSRETFDYGSMVHRVFNNVHFRLFPDEFEIIERLFREVWNKNTGRLMGDGDFKRVVCQMLMKDPPTTFIPQYVVEGVIDELLNYMQAAGEYHWDFSEN